MIQTQGFCPEKKNRKYYKDNEGNYLPDHF